MATTCSIADSGVGLGALDLRYAVAYRDHPVGPPVASTVNFFWFTVSMLFYRTLKNQSFTDTTDRDQISSLIIVGPCLVAARKFFEKASFYI